MATAVRKRKPLRLVRSDPYAVVSNAAGPRYETRNGRRYIVVPGVILKEQVLNGSRGPMFYPAAEIEKNPADWDMIPIVVYHPSSPGDGKPVSASYPGVWEESGIGILQRNTAANGKLSTEHWFDIELVRAYDKKLIQRNVPPILPRLESGKPVSVSTGLQTRNQPKRGVFNGVPYTAIARDYVPDHLAVLPDQEGACSITDGCGLNVNSKRKGSAMPGLITKLKKLIRGAEKGTTLTAANAAKCPECGSPMVALKGGGAKCAECGYKDKAKPDGNDPSKKDMPMKMTANQRAALVGEIVANCDCWKGDEKTLNEMTDEKLQAWAKRAAEEKDAAAVANAAREKYKRRYGKEPTANEMADFLNRPTKKKETPVKKKKKVTANAAAAPAADFAAIIKTAPPEIQAVWNSAVKLANTRKAEIIAALTANCAPEAKPNAVAVYNAMTIEQLEPLAAAIPPANSYQPAGGEGRTVLNFSGAQGAPSPIAADDDEMPLVPTENYEGYELDARKRQSA